LVGPISDAALHDGAILSRVSANIPQIRDGGDT
jgi:hypothetical protein